MPRRALVLLALVSVSACDTAAPRATRPAAKVVTREQFEEYWRDAARTNGRQRNVSQAKAFVELAGRPDRTEKSGDNETWYYERRTRDKVSGQIDHRAVVELNSGFIDRIRFE